MSETKTNEILLARLAEGLDSTAQLTQALLSDLKESEDDFAVMKTELNILKENVQGLSDLVRDGGTTSLLTKIALVEQSISNIKKWVDNHVDVHQRLKTELSDIKEQILNIETRLSFVELTIKEIEKNQEKERKKSKANTMMIGAIIIVFLVGLGYLLNSCGGEIEKPAEVSIITL